MQDLISCGRFGGFPFIRGGGQKGGRVWVEEELAFEVDFDDTSWGGMMDGRYFD